MHMKDWLPHLHKVPGAALQLPSPRLVGTYPTDRLIVKVNTGSPAGLNSSQTPAQWARANTKKRGPWDMPLQPTQFELISYELPATSIEFIEIVRVVSEGRHVVSVREALLALLGPRWASQPHALTFGEAQWRYVWPLFQAQPFTRIIFPGTVWLDPWGFWWSPCVQLTASGSEFGFTCLGNDEQMDSGVWTSFEYAAIAVSS